MKIEKIKNLVANLHDKTEYVIHIRDLKQGLNQGSVLKKLHRINKFKQKAWLKSYTDMNKDLRKKAKYDFEKDFFRLMNMQFLEKPWKTGENIKMLNLSQQKEKETIWCQNQVIILRSFINRFINIRIK